MNLWMLFALIGGITLLERLSFILLLQKWQVPAWLERALKYVPVAVLSALVFPAVLLNKGQLDFSPHNTRIYAALAALLVAWYSRNMLLTILAGMLVLWGLNAWLPA